ncbi:MAG: TolC family protein [Candidatus Aminicenantes bacterium]|nr:TolC family protein [Candidatus Aminicenantes bacterium]
MNANFFPQFNNRKPARLLASALALCCFAFAAAQDAEPRPFSLKAAREFAEANSFETKRSRLDSETARLKLKETVAVGLPQITSAVSYTDNLELPTSLIPNFFEGKFDEKIPVQFGTQHNATANFQVQQLVFNGSYFVGLQTAKLYRDVADLGVEQTRLTVMENVTGTYYLILVAEENERILKSSLAGVEKTAGEVRELNREGFVADTDADLLQITVNQIRNALHTLERQKDVAAKLLKFQMGLDLDEDIRLTDTLADVLAGVDVDGALRAEFSLETNVEYQLTQGQARLADMAFKNEKAKYWPSIAAFFTYQQNAYRSRFNFFGSSERWFPFKILGFNISIPIFRSGAQSARVQQAGLAAEQAHSAAEQAARGIRLDLEQTKARLLSARDNYLTQKDNMRLAERVYGASLEKYREGVASSMELSQAHDKFLQAESGYIQALSDFLTTLNKLDRISAVTARS